MLLNQNRSNPSPRAMATVTIHHDLDTLARAVGDRMDRRAQPGLHDRMDWFRLLVRYCPPEDAPFFILAQGATGGLVLPFSGRAGRARALANWYSLAWAPVSWGEDYGLLEMAVRAIRRTGVVTMAPLPALHAPALADAFRRAGWRAEFRPDKAHWVADTAGLSFEEYWARRPSRLRNTVARKRKKAGLSVEVRDRFDPAAWAAYESIYAASWKPSEGAPAFLRALGEQEGAAGTLRLGIASVDARPVAAQLWLVEGGVATIHKLAYREDAAALSPGSLLSAAMFEHVLTHDRPRIISYGLGDEPYKADWMDQREDMQVLVARNPRHPLGAASLAKASVRRLVKRGAAD